MGLSCGGSRPGGGGPQLFAVPMVGWKGPVGSIPAHRNTKGEGTMNQQSSKKSKRPDNRPARERYWRLHRLREHKVRNLVRYRGMTPEAAVKFWVSVRKGRIKGAA